MTETELLCIRAFLVKVKKTGNSSREIFIFNFVLYTNPWPYKIKYLNGEKIRGSFYEK